MPTPSKTTLGRLQREPKVIPAIQTDLMACQEAVKSGAVVISDEQVRLTQEKAAWYIDLPEFKAERPIQETHVQFLYDEMVKGNFEWSLVILASCDYDGRTWKINGHHTNWAKFFLPNVTPVVREMRFRASTEEELRRLYAKFDRGKPRTEAHLTRVHLAGVAELQEIPSCILNHLNQGLRYWLFPGAQEKHRAKSEDVAGLVRAKYLGVYQKAAVLLRDADYDKQHKHLKRSPVVAAILATLEKYPQVARDFWMAVATGESLAGGDARLVLRNYLMTSSLSLKNPNPDAEMVRHEDMYRRCLLAWNKWRSNEPLKILKTPHERPKIK